nr:4'-phosphopantetheinyl transferase superfamily protein [uncultured Lichenicoccus sp.]
MDGSSATGEVVAYLSRLTGETLSSDRPVRLRSIQRAAFASWSRKQSYPISLRPVVSGKPFRIADLLDGGQPQTLPASNAEPVGVSAAPGATAAILGVGIDIEEVRNLPCAEDYREHPFYKDNFTPAEISHCIRQAESRASLCGVWAAKEAIIKAGRAKATLGQLSQVEVCWDAAGRPTYLGCQLSISHMTTTAVAVCIALA